MDAKGIWNTANSRTINSSTHKVMEKPKLSYFIGANRKVRTKKYQDALRKYRDFLAKQKKQTREETTKETKRGRRPLNPTELRKKKAEKKAKEAQKGPSAKDRVGTVDLESKAYKEAKRINESIPISSPNKTKKKTDTSSNNNQGPNLEAANKVLSGNKKEVTMDDFKGDNKESNKEKPKKKTTREKFNEKFIKTKKGIARRGSIAARRAENREAARKRAQAAAKLRIKKKKEKKS